ncbi:nuclear transport factor 2 family protein [Tengunoibacter tsumagoiensis]|uniref:SnoaL-like domain-containing protein n=1 Tax=Tengunoibacter tsumagoiensis TaxID=2014871 RepID=A0A402A3S2_9CHLR|nr:nuclear transport factor 2 family protein [Tengunoibacter tsumagoiensis]GCE13794.1 hypothetical protein KTT_36530 [Tengunoibacter tsumagoiensis]
MDDAPVQETRLESLVKQWVDAFNTQNTRALVALYTPDAVLFDTGMRSARRGQQEISIWFTRRFRTLSNLCYTPTGPLLQTEAQGALPWRVQGQGPSLFGQRWPGRSFQVDGLSLFTFKADLIHQQRGYYDHLSVIEQLLPFTHAPLSLLRL